MDETDLTLLRRLSGMGIFHRAGELVGDEGLEHLTAGDIEARLRRLVDAGYVNCHYHTSAAGSAEAVRHVHHHRDLRAA